MGTSIHAFLSMAVLIYLVHAPVTAGKKSYIVYLGSHSHGLNPTAEDSDIATQSHYDILESVLHSSEKAQEAVIYSYNKYINGFSAVLSDEEAESIKRNMKHN